MRDLKQINQMRVLYTLPGMEQVPVRRGIVYKTVDGEDLKLDIYYPLDMQPGTARSAVLFVHGGSQPEHVMNVNESGPYVSWCQLVAASGLIAVMFKHRTDVGYTQLPEAASDVDDLVQYIHSNGASLGINPDNLGIWTASSGPPSGLRSVLRDAPEYIRCIAVYYGGLSLMNPTYFTFSKEEESLVKEFSPLYHVRQQDPARVPALFVAKAGLDRPFLNESIDEFVSVASERNIPITFMNHPGGMHGFDILNDDARTREIIRVTLAFFLEYLVRA